VIAASTTDLMLETWSANLTIALAGMVTECEALGCEQEPHALGHATDSPVSGEPARAT